MIFVTGGTGLVGAHLLFELVQKHDAVKALFRSEKRRDHVLDIFKFYSNEADSLFKKIEWLQGDLLDLSTLEEGMKGADLIFHCAALVSFNPGDRDKLLLINERGTANVVNIALESGVKKLAYVSSVAALGRADGARVIDESAVWKNGPENSNYSISKYAAEREVWRGVEEGLPAVIINPSIIFGPGYWNEGSSKIFSSIANGFSFYSEGINGFVDVRDVVKAFVQLAESSIQNERFILCAENESYKVVFSKIAESLGVKAPHRKTPGWLASIVWRVFAVRRILTGKAPLVTKETARTSQQEVRYSNEKIKKALDFNFRPLGRSIQEIGKLYPKN